MECLPSILSLPSVVSRYINDLYETGFIKDNKKRNEVAVQNERLQTLSLCLYTDQMTNHFTFTPVINPLSHQELSVLLLLIESINNIYE